MDIKKIYVSVDKKAYSGLYWLSQDKGQNYVNVSYMGIKKTTCPINDDRIPETDIFAKEVLHDLILNMN